MYEERDGLLQENMRLHTQLDSLKAKLDTCDSLIVMIEHDLMQAGHIAPDESATILIDD